MKLQTEISPEEYKLFKQKQAELHMSEYELLQTIVRGFLHSNIDVGKIVLILKQAMKEFEEIMSCEHCP